MLNELMINSYVGDSDPHNAAVVVDRHEAAITVMKAQVEQALTNIQEVSSVLE